MIKNSLKIILRLYLSFKYSPKERSSDKNYCKFPSESLKNKQLYFFEEVEGNTNEGSIKSLRIWTTRNPFDSHFVLVVSFGDVNILQTESA